LEEIESGRMKEDIVHNKLLIGALKYIHNRTPDELAEDIDLLH